MRSGRQDLTPQNAHDEEQHRIGLKELHININILRITDVDTGSVVAIGSSSFQDWHTYSKVNSGFGRLNGDRATLTGLASMVEDPDLFDMVNIASPELQPPEEEANWLEGDCE